MEPTATAVPDQCNREDYITPDRKNEKDLEVQLVLSLVLGVSAFVTFCVRPDPGDALRRCCGMS